MRKSYLMLSPLKFNNNNTNTLHSYFPHPFAYEGFWQL
jgi:hypothetical protein